jgi:nucleotide-binding universal stress UspA family protein
MKVLVGIDGSEQQADALALGAQLAQADHGRLTIAYAYGWSRWSVRLGAAFHKTLQDDAEALVRDAQATVEGVPSSTRAIADPSAARALHRLAEEEGADVIVVGSSHRSVVGRTLLGSLGDRVITGAPCPVAVAPRGYADRDGIGTIGVAYDASPEAHVALDWAGELARATGASVRVLTVFEPVIPTSYVGGVPYDIQEIEKPLREECRRHLDEAVAALPAGVTGTGEMLSGGPGHTLAEAAGFTDLLVVGSRAYGPLRTVLLGSVSRAVVHHAPCPIVVTPRGTLASGADPVAAGTVAVAGGS